MDRKNKAMLAAAIGAVVILIASSVVRCSLPKAQDEAVQGEPAAIEQDMAEGPGERARTSPLSRPSNRMHGRSTATRRRQSCSRTACSSSPMART